MSFISWLFGNIKKEEANWSEVQREIDKEYNRIAQQFEDNKYEGMLKRQALERFREWRDSKCWLMDFTRYLDIYYIHDSETAKFNKIDANEFRDAEYQRLKKEAIDNAIYPEWFDKYLEEQKEKHKGNSLIDEYFLLYHGTAAILDNAERELVRRKHFNIENKQ